MIDLANLGKEVWSDGATGRHISLHDVTNDFDGFSILENGGAGCRLSYDLVPSGIRYIHQVCEQPFLLVLVSLSGNHVATCFIKCVHLLRCKITSDLSHIPYNFFDERFLFAWLQSDEMSPTLAGDLDECIASHVLYTYPTTLVF